jgi:modulator of drug activity B
MDLAKAFFVERGHQVAETFVERGYDPEEEVKKHVAAELERLQKIISGKRTARRLFRGRS